MADGVADDAWLRSFIEGLPTEEERPAELGELLPRKRCAACQRLLPIGAHGHRRYCGGACRRYAYEQRHRETLRLRRLARRQQSA